MTEMIDHAELLIREAAYLHCSECHATECDDGETPDDMCAKCPLMPFTRLGHVPDGSMLDAVKMCCRSLCGNAKEARGDCMCDECELYEYEGWRYFI